MKKSLVCLFIIYSNILLSQNDFEHVYRSYSSETGYIIDNIFFEKLDLNPKFIKEVKTLEKDTLIFNKKYSSIFLITTKDDFKKHNEIIKKEDSLKKLIPIEKLKKIAGNIKQINGFKKPKTKIDEYKIYLLEKNEVNANGKLILNSIKSDFEIYLSKNELKRYKFFEFKGGFFTKIIEINPKLNDSLKVIVKKEKEYIIAKPAIYLYPKKTEEITIINNFKGKILNTYPSYNEKWKVIAESNGTLTNIEDNKKYEYLFWDGIYNFPEEQFYFKEGFYVKKENIITFLQEKLEFIGLNNKEINDFIVYWLPELAKNEISFIHFEINKNIGNSSILEVSPIPDTTIRLFMEFTKVEKENLKKLKEQQLPSFKRNGFVLIEWGGIEVDSNFIK